MTILILDRDSFVCDPHQAAKHWLITDLFVAGLSVVNLG